ncbi:PH domain-containing protein [Anaerobaca lacustris]|uniref:PH domain-containing protein n=1 Tax=Anaerobaca lacustris TaxID=3044600 RepID=A0AAW6TXW4_9BACT|nr:PH domain-containing protein [Sedimentisphaerales bacterium M17dextr]
MTNGAQRFGAEWSMAVRITTAVVIFATIFVVGVMLRIATGPGPTWLAPLAFVPAAVLSVTILFAPLGFTVDSVGVIIHRLGRNIYIRHDEIASVERIEASQIGLGFRVFGSGGFFGFFGRFYSRQLGRFRGYITNRKDLVLITLRDGAKLVLSPHPGDVFVECAKNARK